LPIASLLIASLFIDPLSIAPLLIAPLLIALLLREWPRCGREVRLAEIFIDGRLLVFVIGLAS
jgi:hypothetical protein